MVEYRRVEKNWMTIYWSGCGRLAVIKVSGYFYLPRGGEQLKVFWNLACLCSASSGSIAWNSRIRFFFFFLVWFVQLTYKGWQVAPSTSVQYHPLRVVHSLPHQTVKGSINNWDVNRFATRLPYVCIVYVLEIHTYISLICRSN